MRVTVSLLLIGLLHIHIYFMVQNVIFILTTSGLNTHLIIIIIIIYLLKKTTYSKRKASEQDRQAQGALTSALMVQVQ